MEERACLLKNKKLIVIGLGKSGESVVEKAIDLCSSITAIDNNPGLDLKSLLENIKPEHRGKLNIMLGNKEYDEKEILEKNNLLVVSPGVPGDTLLIKLAEKSNIPVWSELELAWRLLTSEEQKKTVAVTGTNGKTTVVTLIGEILKVSGRNNLVCGNIGLPLIDTINSGSIKRDSGGIKNKDFKDLFRIIEVSSFQLERTYKFKPFISVILNVTSDHIDRHKTFESYGNLKLKLLENQDKNDWAVVNIDDSYINSRVKFISGRRNKIPGFIKYSLQPKEGADVFYDGNDVFYDITGNKGKIDIKSSLLKGNHNISNMMASVAVALLLGIDAKDIEKAVANFKPLSHRLEYLGCVRGIRCFNDSKSTNPDATKAALGDFGREVTLILGGRDKNMDFSKLIDVLNQKITNLILIGESADIIYEQVMRHNYNYSIFRCKTLNEAVNRGFDVTKQGEVLMLSPACASMDMFKDYKERGNEFKSLVISKKRSR
jgi:UDP-N-acetylmuramoylalanine--D-glutamate ligase